MDENYKRVLTVQDISCVGQCSLTVALPILSACGHETAILPSAVLSTHTAGFTGFTFRDLTDDIPGINAHWVKEGLKFDAIYTGYLGSKKQIEYIKDLFATCGKEGFLKIVDPAMADNGKLYPLFNQEYADEMAKLCAQADYILPNITEACFMTGCEYKEQYDRSYIDTLLLALKKICPSSAVVLTGVSYREGKTGVVVYKDNEYQYYEHKKISQGCHGTGDVYASAFVGALMRGRSAYESAVIAADYTVLCIEKTQGDASHTYGVKFEKAIPELVKMVYGK
ncbi:MAG: pyridoxamine kinase [Sphaerochaetaceae bacterium]|nr:pyridoxamine kinase [Sphaerochaetaceae bacterium]